LSTKEQTENGPIEQKAFTVKNRTETGQNMLDDPDAEFPMVSGGAWYKREQWALLKSTAPDADDLEETYDEWLEFAKHSFKVIWDTGIDLVKVDVDVDELIEWCRNEERPVDGAARTSFVIQKMKEQDLGTGQQPPERDK